MWQGVLEALGRFFCSRILSRTKIACCKSRIYTNKLLKTILLLLGTCFRFITGKPYGICICHSNHLKRNRGFDDIPHNKQKKSASSEKVDTEKHYWSIVTSTKLLEGSMKQNIYHTRSKCQEERFEFSESRNSPIGSWDFRMQLNALPRLVSIARSSMLASRMVIDKRRTNLQKHHWNVSYKSLNICLLILWTCK